MNSIAWFLCGCGLALAASSLFDKHDSPVVQSVERRVLSPHVPGSSPGRRTLVEAIAWTESRNNPHAIGDGGAAVGVLQIHKIMVRDCQRIAPGEHFTYADRLDPERSARMFEVYTEHYSHGATDEVKARRWNGGPHGDTNPATDSYWAKVRNQMENQQCAIR